MTPTEQAQLALALMTALEGESPSNLAAAAGGRPHLDCALALASLCQILIAWIADGEGITVTEALQRLALALECPDNATGGPLDGR